MYDRPQLFAFLICENVVMDGEIPILYRVFDTFNFEFVGNVPRMEGNPPVQLVCKIFTKWGPPGKGTYSQGVALMTPDGQEVSRQTIEVEVGEFRSAQSVVDVFLTIKTPGTYKWALYLDEEKIADHPFIVNIAEQQPTVR